MIFINCVHDSVNFLFVVAILYVHIENGKLLLQPKYTLFKYSCYHTHSTKHTLPILHAMLEQCGTESMSDFERLNSGQELK